jgi:hypothetical protein
MGTETEIEYTFEIFSKMMLERLKNLEEHSIAFDTLFTRLSGSLMLLSEKVLAMERDGKVSEIEKTLVPYRNMNSDEEEAEQQAVRASKSENRCLIDSRPCPWGKNDFYPCEACVSPVLWKRYFAGKRNEV